jgi:hypothetical protein
LYWASTFRKVKLSTTAKFRPGSPSSKYKGKISAGLDAVQEKPFYFKPLP